MPTLQQISLKNAAGNSMSMNSASMDLCRETAPANFKRNDDGGTPTFTSNGVAREECLCKRR